MKKIVKFLTIVTTVFTFSLLPLGFVKAAGLNLSLSPPLLQATIKPGKSISQVFTVYNNSSNPIKLTPQIVPFIPEDDQGNPSLQPRSQPVWLSYFSLINTNIKLGQSFVLPANQSDQLVLTIKVPSNAPLADHYATLLLSSENQTPAKEGSDPSAVRSASEERIGTLNALQPNNKPTSISGSIGANILLTVNNLASPPTILNIVELKPTNTWFLKIGTNYILDNLSPIKFTAKLENQGRFLAQAHGLFQIHKKSKVIYLEPLTPAYVLAQSSRKLTASSSAAVSSGQAQISFTPSLIHIGKYSATLDIRSENGSTQNSIQLILLPVKAAFSLILGIILLKSILTFRKPGLSNPASSQPAT